MERGMDGGREEGREQRQEGREGRGKEGEDNRKKVREFRMSARVQVSIRIKKIN